MKSMTVASPSPSSLAPSHRYEHTNLGGFCSVCGSVFPCAKAGRELAGPRVLVPVGR